MEEDLPVKVYMGRNLTNPDVSKRLCEIDKKDAKAIMTNASAPITWLLTQDILENYHSDNAELRREAKTLAVKFLPYILKQKGVEMETKKSAAGGISNALADQFSKLIGRDITDEESDGS